ncbi:MULTISPECIES: alanine/glycine:cation symporter family protein [unclassified Flavonifractor]|uniref:alanine/glycine:cation symporter family protein n=1 Tax=unclassified Flavonifractor TaxID=2629267 RepID=UPI000B36CB4E|nr:MULTISPECIES: sodium:alanine symporter family protein [unclassified Flavonifractor]OUN12065.1 sodium:alanine symporter family protein [Flavonifractor sp. An9]OUN85059.1 sodium:alanine symporter family protein [Flavonifractor sp. An52]OUO15825.1 sodium:alanine symporter family protein [Flavonifractor sp. An4]HIZ92860.1 sodium:alanine symporter family protein [Candidatus Flavonifractor avicola]
MEWIEGLVGAVNTVLWDYALLFLLVATGIFFTVRLGFIQLRKFGEGMRRLFGGFSMKGARAGKEGMSSFQALTTAIAAQVGTGNITGCATALYSGGPGAIFWMWLSAFFGMATIYSEAVLAQRFRTTDADGHVTGGPLYYIRAAFRGKFGKFLSGFFAIAIILALGFMGNMVQSNSIGDAFHTAFGIPKLVVGVVVAVIAAFIFLGGVRRIASFTEKIVPIMAFFYIVGCIIILCINHETLLSALRSIFVCAFDPQAVFGGALGLSVREAMRYGVARGLFSNEAGMGSTPHAHAMAKVEKPQDQGIIAMMGVFIDTFVVLTLTALVIISSGMLQPVNGPLQGTALAQAAFNAAFGSFGNAFVAICMLFFAFSTIIGWYFFGEVNVKALFGKTAAKGYAVIVVVFIVVGSTLKVDLVWSLSDMFNGLMVLPNLIGLLALSGLVVKITRGSGDQLHR